MRALLAPVLPAIMLLPLALPAAAEDAFVKRDARGRVTERWQEQKRDTYVVRDAQGRKLGTAERTANGSILLRDLEGRPTARFRRR